MIIIFRERIDQMNRQDIEKLLLKVAHNMTEIKNSAMDESCPIGIIDFSNWEWAQGVGLYGLYRYAENFGDKAMLGSLFDWFDTNIKKGIPEKNVNTTTPMLTLAFLYEKSRREDYLELIKEWSEWIMTCMPRTEHGGLQHIVSGMANDGQLWDDTLFMTVLFLAKAGTILNRQEYVDEAVYQFLLHIKYLADKKSGLWYHGWTFAENHNFANAFWARGNCWITAGIPEFLEISKIDGSIKRFLLDTLSAQVKTLAEYQERNGMWHTLIDDKTSYTETSATSGFGYGILKSVRLGYIGKSFKKTGIKALKATIENIRDDGTVENVSYGTGMGKTLEDYREIPLCPMAYGNALAILILNEGLYL